MSAIPVLVPVTALAAAVLAGVAGLWRPAVARVIAATGTASAGVLSAVGLTAAVRDAPLTHDLGGWPPPIGIEYVLDPLSGFMALLITVVGTLVIVYTPRAGFGGELRRGVPVASLTLLLITGLLGVVMSGDLFNLYVFLEVYAIATYALVTLGGAKATLASLRYLLLGGIGSGFYLLGIGFVYFSTGSLNMADVATRLVGLGDSPTVIAAAVLIVVGLGIKMALFPLHVWLPDAHSYAPPSVAALLAAIQVKAAAYALIRVLLGVFGPEYVIDELPLMEVLAWFGAGGIVVGTLLAVRQDDFKRMLAYSTVAQLGYIGLGIGLANPIALAGALFHILAHALAKSCMFFVAGSVIDRTGLKAVSRFGGLGPRMPWTMGGFAVAAMSMVGIPGTAGFVSKFYLVWGSVDAGRWLFAALIVVSSLGTLAYFLKVFERVHMAGDLDVAAERAGESQLGIVGPILVLATGLVVFGVASAGVFTWVLRPIASTMLGL